MIDTQRKGKLMVDQDLDIIIITTSIYFKLTAQWKIDAFLGVLFIKKSIK